MPNSLKKIINLVKKSKERVILFDDSDFNDGVVVLTLDEYQKIKGKNKGKDKGKVENKALTENNVIDSINKDIAILAEKGKEQSDSLVEWFYNNFYTQDVFNDDNGDFDEYENLYYYNDNESFTHFSIEQDDNDVNKDKNVWNIPVDIKEGAE